MKKPPLKQKAKINPVLQKIMDDLAQKVSADNKAAYERVVIAGSKIMFDPKTHGKMELVRNPASRANPEVTISNGIAGLMWLMFLQSQKKMGFEPLIMGGLTLMCQAIDFAERGLGIKFDEEMISNTSRMVVEHLFEKMGITPEQLHEAIQKGGAEIDEWKKTGKLPENPVIMQAAQPQQQQPEQPQSPEQQPQQQQVTQPPPGALG